MNIHDSLFAEKVVAPDSLQELLPAENPPPGFGQGVQEIVGAGGALGAIARYGLTVGVAKLVSPSVPWGVLTVNVLGSLLMGGLAGIGESRHVFTTEQRLFLFVGILGGFTTFSSITNDTFALLRAENYLGALANVGLSLALGLAAVAVGFVVGRTGA